ncbi:hypothetical protein F4802DRAFT_578404 [Xylaria palmicola]|nr:hypothetical protein F4802DRAFT_578404 [Xylaria palmicola]
MASYGGPRTCTPSEFHLALLRPVILQILRAQGYYASTAGTIDCLTELAGQYLYAVAKRTAEHATLNNRLGPPGTPGLVDVRRALEECGALCPGTSPGEPPPAKRRRLSSSGGAGGDGHDDHGHDDHDDDHDEDDEDDEEAEDTAGVDEFISWAMGRKNQRIRKVAGVVAPVGAIEAGAEGEDGMVEEERPSDYLDGKLFFLL